MAKTATMKYSLSMVYDKAVGDQTDDYKPTFTFNDTLAEGTGDDQYDLFFNANDTINGTKNYDLAGSLTDSHGDTLTFVELNGVYVKNTSTSSGQNVTVGAHPTSAVPIFSDVSDSVVLDPDGMLFLWWPKMGKTVTAGTADVLRIFTNASIAVTIALVGRSA